MSKGTLYLIPTPIAPDTQHQVLSAEVSTQIAQIDHYLVEHLRTARRFISSLKIKPVPDLSFEVLDKNTQEVDVAKMLVPLTQGKSVGILSEAGCPGVADPGHLAVAWAHKNNYPVVPLVGPVQYNFGLDGQRI